MGFPRLRILSICALLALALGRTSAEAQLSAYTFTNAFPALVFSNAVCIASPPGETNRLFIVEKHGRIIVITNLAKPSRKIFMDMSDLLYVDDRDEAADLTSEDGLTSIVFHPGYATNRLFYTFYTGWANNGSVSYERHDILSSFQTSASDPNQGDLSSETQLILQYDRMSGHTSGDLHFGPDGYLYVSLGDEGYQYNSGDIAQHIDRNFFSGILRIDVDKRPGSLKPNPSPEVASTTNYAVPPDNPFVGATHFDGLALNVNQLRTEFWAVGFRNPWRFSFDPLTGTLYCGDVGQDEYEEINIISRGGNYGWASYEGSNSPPTGVVTNGWPVPKNPRFPIVTFAHKQLTGGTNGPLTANAVIGGQVYRGYRFPELIGNYIFADYVGGNVWTLMYTGTNVTMLQRLFVDPGISTFGVDPSNGDILYVDLRQGNNAIVNRIVTVAATGSLRVNLDPVVAISNGAQWRVNGGPWQSSGNTVAGLAPGNHVLSFKPVSGWNLPASRTALIHSRSSTLENGSYTLNESTKPSLTITTPTQNLHVSNMVFTATGTATDNAPGLVVRYQLNGGAWLIASGTTNWAAPNLVLAPGANTFNAYAIDPSGNVSAIRSVSFSCILLTPLVAQANGQGTISPNYNGQLLQVGENYTMSAKAAKGFDLANWSGSITTSQAKLTFVMASNLSFTANFVDVKAPVNIISFPAVNRHVTNALLRLAGKASDNSSVASVWYHLNGGSWGLAGTTNGWTNWAAAGLIPLSGANLAQAWAIDGAGNISRTNSVKFTYDVVPSADWAPDSLSGLIALATMDASNAVNLSFDALAFSQNSGTTDDDFSVGRYRYVKTGTNRAQLTLTNTAPPNQTNDAASLVALIFTNHYAGIFTNQDGDGGTIRLSIANNFVPATISGKTLLATESVSSSTTTFVLGKGTFTRKSNGSTPAGAGTYTFSRCSPVTAFLVLTFTDATNAGNSVYVQANFTSKTAGNYFAVTCDPSGHSSDSEAGRFSLH